MSGFAPDGEGGTVDTPKQPTAEPAKDKTPPEKLPDKQRGGSLLNSPTPKVRSPSGGWGGG